MTLASDGQSAYVIAVRGDSALENHAAQQLQRCFEARAGCAIPVVQADQLEAGSSAIVIGTAAASALPDSFPRLEDQSSLVVTRSPRVYIVGGSETGTLYGVHWFAERVLGVRWLSPDCRVFPSDRNIPLPELHEVVRPAFPWRHTSYSWPGARGDFWDWLADNVVKGEAPSEPAAFRYGVDGFAHSYFRFVSPDEFFQSHPEYFSEIGGSRRGSETQLCLSNPEVLDIVATRMLKRMADMPECQQHNFSQMDCYNACECRDCARINARYGTMGGTQYWFLNQLAERTSREFTDKLIGTLAYMYTEEPPRNLKLHPNVAVWLCHMHPCCDSHPIAACPDNSEHKRRAEGWAKICSHLYIWHYVVNFSHYYMPFPNLRAVANDIRFYRDIGVEGVFLQGMGHEGGGGEWSLLRPYVLMKLLWDPDRDLDELVREFLEAYYGAAAGPIEKHLRLIHDKVERQNIHMHLYTTPAQGYLTDDVLDRSEALFDEAEASVFDDTTLSERVAVARMPLTYARLFPRDGYTIEDDVLSWKGMRASPDEAGAFRTRMARHGFRVVREWYGEPGRHGHVCFDRRSEIELAVLENDWLRVEVAPFLGGRILRIVDKQSGECVCATNRVRNIYFPYCGGEETRLGEWLESYMVAHMEAYDVIERCETHVLVGADTVRGIRLERRIELAPDNPSIQVVVTAINHATETQGVRLRSHFDLDLGPLDSVEVQFIARTGNQITQDMKPVLDANRVGLAYREGSAPAGEWTLSGGKGLRLTQTWNDANVDFTSLCIYPESLGQVEAEVWSNRVRVAAGGRTAFAFELTVGRAIAR